MRYLSVCSGIEAATQAFEPRGWEPVAFSEIEPFPSAVLAHHYPDVPNWGDMTKFKEWPDAAIDVLVGGTPCQSFSVAGLRKGLADPRGNLMLTYLAIAERYRPRWIVWENVPGVLSSNGGRDFGSFLGGLGQLGYGFAYRVLDAQFVRTRRFPWAVPQRRRRVFVIGYLGDWRRAAAVLFDRESLSGNSPPRREAGKAVAASLTASTGGCSGKDDPAGRVISTNSGDVGYCLTASAQNSLDAETETLMAVAGAICRDSFSGGAGGRPEGAAAHHFLPVAFDCKGTEVQTATDGSHPTLRSMGHSNSHQNAGGHAAVAVYPLNTQLGLRGADTSNSPREGLGIGDDGEPSFTLQAAHSHAIISPWAVRRLTPVECERLQAFPDNFTRIPYRNKPADKCPDGPRYKALGNSMAVNCMDWLGERIDLIEAMSNPALQAAE